MTVRCHFEFTSGFSHLHLATHTVRNSFDVVRITVLREFNLESSGTITLLTFIKGFFDLDILLWQAIVLTPGGWQALIHA